MSYFEKEDIEDIILGMADIVRENRYLRQQLAEAEEYKRKYDELLNQQYYSAREGSALMLKAIMEGAFTGKAE